MAPFTFQGLYPSYPMQMIFYPMVVENGGIEALNNIANLEPGAWKQEAVIEALRDFKDYCNKYLMKGTLALSHTEAQMEFINHRAAMIPCGTYLENEMKGYWPDNFELSYVPSLVNKYTNNKYVVWSTSPRAVPKNAKNIPMAMEFMKLMYRDDVRILAGEVANGVYPIYNSSEGFEDKLPPSIVKANKMVEQDNVIVISYEFERWYKPLYKKAQDSFAALIVGDYTVEKFVEEVETEAERIRQDDSIVKYRITQ